MKTHYTNEEAKEFIESKGFSWEKFNKWMNGQTGEIIDGQFLMYASDVERYRE